MLTIRKLLDIIGHMAAALLAVYVVLIVSFMFGLFYRVTYLNTLTTQVGWAFFATAIVYVAGLLLVRFGKGAWHGVGLLLCQGPILFALFFIRYAYMWRPY